MPLDENGLTIPSLSEILEEKNAQVKGALGQDLDVSPQSPDGQINGVLAESDYLLYQLIQAAYNAFNPSAVAGVTQDHLVELNGLTRNPATPAKGDVTLTGTPGTLIFAGSLVASATTDEQFSILSNVTIPASGTIDAEIESINTGPLIASAGTITNIVTPVAGWATVNNALDLTPGTNQETDQELRVRRTRSVANPSQGMVESIFSSVADVDGTTNVIVLENDTGVVSPEGLPPHSTEVIVVGGDNQEIAEAYFNSKSAGIQTYGSANIVSAIVQDFQGIDYTINFTRPTETNIYVEVELSTFDGFPSDGVSQVKQAIVDYAQGILECFEGQGFNIGDDIVYTRLFSPINTVPGHQINSLTIGVTPPPIGTTNIPIAYNELGVFEISNIAVNVV